MINESQNNIIFENCDYSQTEFTGNEFDSCEFLNCNFSETDLSDCDFIDCKFENCNLGLTKLNGTGLKNVRFNKCKLTGVDFSFCSDFLFDVGFIGCIFSYAIFFKNSLVKSVFDDCTLNEAQFTESDLREAEFKNCSLSGTVFIRNNMEGADFRTAENYIIDPELNRMKNALFSLQGVSGLLFKYDIVIE